MGGIVHRKRLAIVDEHEVFRRGVLAILADDPFVEVIHESRDGPPPAAADVVVASPGGLREIHPEQPALVCWGPSDPPIAPSNGRRLAIVDRDGVRCDQLLGAVRALGAGLSVQANHNCHRDIADLDARRRHILQLLSEGADTRGISTSLFYSERTVKGLIKDIEEKLSARNRAEAVAKGIRLGLI
jgi:DNA-binding NarL/FixJ family response regulator